VDNYTKQCNCPEIQGLFDYRQAGSLAWKIKASPHIKIGDVAGYKHESGYHKIKINGKSYRRARLVWLWHYGVWPNRIDHINRNPSDDRIENLRDFTLQNNQRNRDNPKNNTSGVVGVCWHKRTGTWRARIAVMKKDCHLGHYNDFDNAVLARLAGEQCLGWSDSNDSSPAYKHALKNDLVRG